MKTRLKINKINQNILVYSEVEVFNESGDSVWVLVRKQNFLRNHIHPQTYDIQKGFICISVDGMGDFFIDQSESKNQSLRIVEVESTDTSLMTNEELWDELIKY